MQIKRMAVVPAGGNYSSIYVAAALLKEWFGMFGAAKMGSGLQTLKSMTAKDEKKKKGKGAPAKKKNK